MLDYNRTSDTSKFQQVILTGLAVVGPLLLYLLTMAPDITWSHQGADGGDLITAAYTLGVPHPSGYPTYVLVGWLFGKLPFGSIGWRFNLLSAVGVAASAGLIFQLTRAVTHSRLAGFVAAWTLATTPLVWSQALITEVYGLNLFFVAWLLWLGWRAQSGDQWATFWPGLAFGLALGAHLTSLFMLPWLIGCVACARRAIWSRLIAGTGVGLLIFLYLPLRANAGAITWGDPATLNGFWDLVSGRIYRGYLFDLPPTSFGPRLLALVGYLTEIGPLALILAGIGLGRAWADGRRWLLWSAVSGGGYIIYALAYRTADSYILLLPVFVLIALIVGLGCSDVMSKAPTRWWRWSLIALLLVALLAGGLMTSSRLSLRDEMLASQFWQTVLAQAPPGAILLTYQDRHTFTLWYAQHVLGQRPDVAIVDTGLLAYDWYRRNLKQNYPWLTDAARLPLRFEQRQAMSEPLCAVLTGTAAKIEQGALWNVACLKE